jgi:hypothetical protein
MGEFRYIGLAALRAKAIAALEQAVNETAEDLVGKAQAATPVETGTLRGSIHTDGARVSGDSVTARVQTGGEASAYAIIIHEGHRADGSYPRRAGPAKYIERPLVEEAPVYLAHLTAAARSEF